MLDLIKKTTISPFPLFIKTKPENRAAKKESDYKRYLFSFKCTVPPVTLAEIMYLLVSDPKKQNVSLISNPRTLLRFFRLLL